MGTTHADVHALCSAYAGVIIMRILSMIIYDKIISKQISFQEILRYTASNVQYSGFVPFIYSALLVSSLTISTARLNLDFCSSVALTELFPPEHPCGPPLHHWRSSLPHAMLVSMP